MKRAMLFMVSVLLFFCCSPELDDNQGNQNEQDPSQDEILLDDETLVSNLNNNVISLQDIIERLFENDYVKNIDTVYGTAGTIEKYVLKFAEDSLNTNGIDIYLQPDGASSGQDIAVSVKKDSDSSYYWMVDKNWITDAAGDKIKVSDTTGVALKTKIQDNYWYYSYDGGKSWVKAGKATNQSLNYVFTDMRIDGDKLVLSLADGTNLKIPLKKEYRLYYTVNKEELQGWSEGVFIEDGTWALSKPMNDEGYLLAIGEANSKEGIIVYLDTLMRVREMYTAGAIICMHDYTQDSVKVDVIDKADGNVSIKIPFKQSKFLQSPISSGTKSTASDISVGYSVASNFIGMGEAIFELGKNANIKGNLISFAKNKFEFTIGLFSALTGKDVYENHKFLGNALQIASLGIDIKQFQQFKALSLSAGSSVLGVIAIYAGLYAEYKSLYDEHIEALYASCAASIKNIDVKGLSANIEVEISGHEKWQNNLQCGVAVGKFLKPSFDESGEVKSITHNGVYDFNISGLEMEIKYHCRPFVTDKNRTSLWIGFIGDLVGPLVRYGEESTFEVPLPGASMEECMNITDKSAVAKCSFSNTNASTACGVKLEWDGGSSEISASNRDGEQNVTLSGLKANTTYTCTAYVKYNNKMVYSAEKSFTTTPPDISGSWSCKEVHYNYAGQPQYQTYNVTLNSDGTVIYSESDEIFNSSWSFSKSGQVIIDITDIATISHASGKHWEGTVDDIASPRKIIGHTNRWNANNVGSFNGESIEFEMTR